MSYYVITSSNSINNTTDNLVLSALHLSVGDRLLVRGDGSVLATGAGSDAVYLDAYGDNGVIIIDGLVAGTRGGIHSLAQYADITVNGTVYGESQGVSISNQGTLFVSSRGLVSGGEGVALSGGSTLVNDGTVNGTGNDAIQISSGTIVNNGLISSRFSSIFYGGDGAVRITNTGTIEGDITTWYNASAETADLTIENYGSWFGSLGLSPGADDVVNTGTITGDVTLGDGTDTLDSRYGLITGSISGGKGADWIRAGRADDTIEGGAGGDTIDGGAGVNTVSYSGSGAGVRVNLVTGAAQGGHASGDKLARVQNVTGSLQKDWLTGDERDNALVGVLGEDVLIGNGGDDSFLMYGGGPVTIEGGAGNDLIQLLSLDPATYGFAFRTTCRINGGTGYDTLDLSKAGTVAFNNTTLLNVERILVQDGANYNLVAVNATVAAGALLEVDGTLLTGIYRVQFDGSAETNGSFVFDGGEGKDVFAGGALADVLTGNGGGDTLAGGLGADTFQYGAPADSLFANRDSIEGFVAGTDQFRLDVAVTGIDAPVSGGASGAADLNALAAGHLLAHHAILVTVNGGALAGQKFLIVDANGTNGYQWLDDYVMDVTGITGVLSTGDFVV